MRVSEGGGMVWCDGGRVRCNDSPAYADGDNACHCRCLNNMACCHIITCTLHHFVVWLASTVVVVWVASDGGWWVVAIGDGDVELMWGHCWWQLTMVVVVGRQTVSIVCLLFVVPN